MPLHSIRQKPLKYRLFLLVFGFLSPAFAHHGVGHVQSESQRTLASLGGNPRARQRAALVTGASRSSNEPTLNTATTYGISALINIRLVQRIYWGVELPFVLVDEDEADSLKVGYGDTRTSVQASLGSLEEGATQWTAAFNLSIPTRTITYEADPGAQWIFSPQLNYADQQKQWAWFAFLQTPIEVRPAGTAVDLSPSVAVSYLVVKPLSLTLGASADIRILNFCASTDGTKFCSDGRASEDDRPIFALRAYAQLAASLRLSPSWSLFTSGQIPFTRRKDVQWFTSLGVEVRF